MGLVMKKCDDMDIYYRQQRITKKKKYIFLFGYINIIIISTIFVNH